MRTTISGCVALVVALAILLLPGCIERKETIRVEGDGRVEIEVVHEADAHGEMYLGDSVPAIDRGWLVEDWIEQDEEGKERFFLRATASFPAGSPLPGSYASVLDPDPAAALQFPTTLWIEERPDGIYYHFQRVYRTRPWAFIENPARIVRERIRETVGEREFEDLPATERAAVIKALVDVEVLKFSAFARRAFEDVSPDVPQDVWLLARAAIREAGDGIDVARIVELLDQDEETAGEQAIEREARAFEDAATTAMRQALLDSGVYGQRQLKAFSGRFEHYRRYHEITEELGDDNFTITLEMPGEIVGHNADRIAGRAATWTFNGQFLRDRDHELLVTSRVPF